MRRGHILFYLLLPLFHELIALKEVPYVCARNITPWHRKTLNYSEPYIPSSHMDHKKRHINIKKLMTVKW